MWFAWEFPPYMRIGAQCALHTHLFAIKPRKESQFIFVGIMHFQYFSECTSWRKNQHEFEISNKWNENRVRQIGIDKFVSRFQGVW